MPRASLFQTCDHAELFRISLSLRSRCLGEFQSWSELLPWIVYNALLRKESRDRHSRVAMGSKYYQYLLPSGYQAEHSAS